MPTLSCLSAFLTLFPILQAKYYHQSTTHTHTHLFPLSYKGVTNSLRLLVWDEISLFQTRQRFITIPSPSPPTPPPRPHTLYAIAICVSLK